MEKEMATLSSILAWRIPWTEESGRLQLMRSKRIRQDWATNSKQPLCKDRTCPGMNKVMEQSDDYIRSRDFQIRAASCGWGDPWSHTKPSCSEGPQPLFYAVIAVISPFNLCFVSEGHRISGQRGGRAVCVPRVPCRPLHTQQKDSRCPISRESWGPRCMGFLQGSEEPGGKRLPSTTE